MLTVSPSYRNIYYIGMFGGMIFMGVVYAYKPDTRCVDGIFGA